MDRLRLFLQGPTARGLGPGLCAVVFECRRAEAEAFRALFGEGKRRRAPEMDAVLHEERLAGGAKRRWERLFDQLPDGAMKVLEGLAFAIYGDALMPWRFDGYGAARKRPAAERRKC
jgi:hypothetical protein